MDALSALLNRRSVAKLGGAAPTPEQVEILIKAASRAADHGNLQPWRFLVIEGQALVLLGQVFVKAAQQSGEVLTQEGESRYLNMPLRAPMIITVVAKTKPHPKVPEIEQLLAAGAAAQNILNAAHALGLGAIWRTGNFAFDPLVKSALELESDEQIIGFIYLGEPQMEMAPAKEPNLNEILTFWAPKELPF